jgi:hypothetical protein
LISFVERRHFNYEPDIVDHEVKDGLLATYDYDDKKREVKDALFATYGYDDKKCEVNELKDTAFVGYNNKKREVKDALSICHVWLRRQEMRGGPCSSC